MMNFTTVTRLARLSVAAGFVLMAFGAVSEAHAQRDPFAKPSFMRARKPASPTANKPKGVTTPTVPVNFGPPAIEARIEYFKRLREAAADNGSVLPKVTSVLTLNEMAVTGIFKTPRGYAAMIEATPIKLSYTIYPGEKFFDGQLVAVEENRLVFRKVTKVGEGKFVASVENKPLKQYTNKAQIEGTAPAQPGVQPVETASNNSPSMPAAAKPSSNPFLSPVDEMNRQPAEPASPLKDKAKKASKASVKVAKTDRP